MRAARVPHAVARSSSMSHQDLPASLWPVVFANAHEAILLTDARGRIVDVNPSFTRITGYARDEAVGRPMTLLKSGYQDAAFYASFWAALRDQGRWQGEIWNRRKDGSVFPEYLTVSAVPEPDTGRTYYLGIFYDLEFVREHTARLSRLAHQDALCGLPNRLALDAYLPKVLARARRRGTQLLVGMLDLDDFKSINDQLGHRAGDDLLRLFAGRLRDSVRGSDFVARLGGDEFVVVLGDLDGDDEIDRCLERIGQVCDEPFMLERAVEVGISLGWTLYPDDDPSGDDASEQLLHHADMALYLAKAGKLGAQWQQRWGRGAAAQLAAARPARSDGYDARSAELLAQAASAVAQAASRFVDAFYSQLVLEAEPRRILDAFTPDEMERLKARQAAHLRELLGPELGREAHRELALHVGRVHALIGLRHDLLVQAMGIYQELLVERLIALPLRVAERAALVQLAALRLKDELQQQAEAAERLREAYRAFLLGCMERARHATGVDALMASCLDAMVQLPGIAAAAWGRPGADAQVRLQHAVGRFAQYEQTLRDSGLRTRVGYAQADAGSTAARAWRATGLVVNPSYRLGERELRWREAAQACGIRTSAGFAVRCDGKPLGVVTVYGEFPGQFESGFIRDELEALRQLLELACRGLPD